MPGIFISYRRSDNPDATGRIYDRLVSEFGKSRVFKDVDSIPLGQDFRGHLNDIVGNCAAVLAIIGPRWKDARNDAGNRRLEDSDDFVRIELEAALARNIPVVPVLVGHATMPGAADLPSSLGSMVYRQSIEVRPDPDFHHDSTRLVSALRQILDPGAPVEPDQPATTSSAEPRSTQRTSGQPWILAFAIAAGLAAAVLAWPALKYLRAPPLPEMRTEIVTPETSRPTDFALSPDGSQIAFVAKEGDTSRLWLRSLSSTSSRSLAGTDGASSPFWSPDGRSIGFLAGRSLQRLDLAGGVPQTLASVGNGGTGSWGADGVILYTRGPADSLQRITASGGATSPVAGLDSALGPHRTPQFLPDGRRFLFAAINPTTRGIYLGSLDGSAPIRVLSDVSSVALHPSGWLLWLRGGALSAQKFDLEKGALSGEPITVADRANSFSVSESGMLAYRTGGSRKLQMKWMDRTGASLGTLGDIDGSLNAPRVAPDGRRVVVSRQVQGNEDIWLFDGARASRVSFDPGPDQYPAWSSDGARIVYLGIRRKIGMYMKLASGAGEEELLLPTSSPVFPSHWSTDGRFLLYFSGSPDSNTDLMVLPMSGERKPFVFLKTPFTETWGQFSRDGRWVAYQSDESGNDEIYVRPFVPPGETGGSAATGGKWQVSTAGGVHPMWSQDGKQLYYVDPEGGMMAAPIVISETAVVPGAPVRMFQSQVAYGGVDYATGRQYDIAADGRFLINTELDISDPVPITLIQNWNPEVKP